MVSNKSPTLISGLPSSTVSVSSNISVILWQLDALEGHGGLLSITAGFVSFNMTCTSHLSSCEVPFSMIGPATYGCSMDSHWKPIASLSTPFRIGSAAVDKDSVPFRVVVAAATLVGAVASDKKVPLKPFSVRDVFCFARFAFDSDGVFARLSKVSINSSLEICSDDGSAFACLKRKVVIAKSYGPPKPSSHISRIVLLFDEKGKSIILNNGSTVISERPDLLFSSNCIKKTNVKL